MNNGRGVSWGRGGGPCGGHGCTAENCGPSPVSWRLSEARQVAPSSFWEMI